MTTPMYAAQNRLDDALIELDCFAQTLDAPDDAPPFTFVLRAMVGRITDRWEELQSLINGGMGVMTPMETNPVESSIDHRGGGICELHDESARPD
ncbi:hypothetical protein [Hydrogenophaga sp.]|uniref:hypothetical protein n=1 Tax=Hydrogenophaga sp. TaxID=1904254 RepID=UPI0035B0AAF9